MPANPTAITDWEITEAMIQYGGSFVQGLGRLYRTADLDNQLKLRTAFDHYFNEYRKLAVKERHAG